MSGAQRRDLVSPRIFLECGRRGRAGHVALNVVGNEFLELAFVFYAERSEAFHRRAPATTCEFRAGRTAYVSAPEIPSLRSG